ncbi:MAG TPA: Ran-binding zinc finger domain-containing protein [Longimicrobium sp.]|nr:Ran-binding zinc finger domain-containing protein [Longimicrobium sp.]
MAIREGRWDCPSCGSRGQLGRNVNCAGCGNPRPKGIRFYLPGNEPEVSDAARLAEARAGADWVCEHCGGSARATQDACPGCGAPRGSSPGQETRVYGSDEVPRSGDDDEKPAAPQPLVGSKARGGDGGKKSGGGCGCLGCIGLIILFFMLLGMCDGGGPRRSSRASRPVERTATLPEARMEAVITAKRWMREVHTQSYRTVTEDDWTLPAGAQLVRSYRAVRSYNRVLDHYETRTRQRSERVQVGTREYTCGQRDLGNGYFEDVTCTEPEYETRSYEETYQEPVYRNDPVYATKYEYRIKRWVPNPFLVERGVGDTDPVWPAFTPSDTTREMKRAGVYEMTFKTADGKTYTTDVGIQDYRLNRLNQAVMIQRIGRHDVDIVRGRTAEAVDTTASAPARADTAKAN